MGKSDIEWIADEDGNAGDTWGVLRGCSRKSPGCGGGRITGPNGERGGCYAEAIAGRFSWPADTANKSPAKHKPGTFFGFAEMVNGKPHWTGKVELVHSELLKPLRKRKATTYFISMSDVFHEALPDSDIDKIFATILACEVLENVPAHIYKLLTKRADRMREYFSVGAAVLLQRWAEAGDGRIVMDDADIFFSEYVAGLSDQWKHPERILPLRNLHLGVSVELPEYKSRIDDLRACDVGTRFISFEPLLGDVGTLNLTGIHQVIAGAESGGPRNAHARPMDEDWVRGILRQATEQGVARFFKQKLDERRRKVSLPLLDGVSYAEQAPRPGALPSPSAPAPAGATRAA